MPGFTRYDRKNYMWQQRTVQSRISTKLHAQACMQKINWTTTMPGDTVAPKVMRQLLITDQNLRAPSGYQALKQNLNFIMC